MSETPGNTPEFSVSEISAALKRTVEGEFAQVRVRGELSGVKHHSSGHLYFGLKDDRAALDGVCWRGTVGRLACKAEDGLEVIVTGRLTTYAQRSKYQIVVEQMEPAGEGALMALLEERKRKLAAEGLFAAERKRALPFLPEVIAIVTSPTGAVIRDILHRLNERFPRHVLLWPVAVQGEQAAGQVAAAVEGINRAAEAGEIPRPDVMIVARGGGSIEDLWPFNEEIVVRAVAASAIPVISAVGHETDTTLIDHAADRRAPTPTAAAEFAVPVRADLVARVADLDRRQQSARSRLFDRARDRLAGLARGLPRPRDMLGQARQGLDDLADRLPRGLRTVTAARGTALARLEGSLRPARLRTLREQKRRALAEPARRLAPVMSRGLADRRQRLTAAARLLETMSYRAVLRRGYAVLRDDSGAPVTAAAALTPGMRVEAELADGRAGLVVEGESGAPATLPKQPRKSRRSASGGAQGSLF